VIYHSQQSWQHGRVDWAEVLDELYALAPGDFTATRDERAKQARADGDRALATRIAALRKPLAAAWAVNLLVRAAPGPVEQLLALGESMREAQDALAGPELRELRVQQHQVLEAMRVQATGLARDEGGRLSPDAGEQVVSTLRAGMTDAAAADAVRSGRLVRVLEATGFGDVDTDGAVAGEGDAPAAPRPAAGTTPRNAPRRTPGASPPGRAPRARATPPDELRARREEKERREADRAAAEAERRDRERREHEAALDRAREELADAEDAAREAEADAGSAGARTQELRQRHEDLLAQVASVAEQLEAARAAERAAERGAHAAAERRSRAERTLERLGRQAVPRD